MLKNAQWDESSNIFTEIFKTSIQKINEEIEAEAVDKLYEEISWFWIRKMSFTQ